MEKVTATFVEAIERSIEVDGVVVVLRTADMDQIFAMLAHAEPLHAELARAPQSVLEAINGETLSRLTPRMLFPLERGTHSGVMSSALLCLKSVAQTIADR